MTTHAAVGVDDDLATGQTGVAHRSADDELTGRVDVELGLGVDETRGDHRLDDLLHDELTEGALLDVAAVLARDDDGVDAARPAVDVLDRHLRLAVGAEEGVDPVAPADLGEVPRQLVREADRHRHQLVGVGAGEAEHHALVAGALLLVLVGVDAHRDVGALPLDRHEHAARVGVKAHVGADVADLVDRLADDLRDVDVRRGRHLAGDVDVASLDEGLARDPAGRVLGDDRVEDRVADLVADLIRVAFGDRFASEETACHI